MSSYGAFLFIQDAVVLHNFVLCQKHPFRVDMRPAAHLDNNGKHERGVFDMRYIDELMFPLEYYEIDVQDAIIANLSCIFPGFRTVNKSKIMRGDWRPDLVIYHGEIGYVIIELKCNFRRIEKAACQLVEYAEAFSLQHPNELFKAMIIGALNVSSYIFKQYDLEDNHIIYCQLQKLGRAIALGNNIDLLQQIKLLPYYGDVEEK